MTRITLKMFFTCMVVAITTLPAPGAFAQDSDEPFDLVQSYRLENPGRGLILQLGAKHFIPHIRYLVKEWSGREFDDEKRQLINALPGTFRQALSNLKFLYSIQVQHSDEESRPSVDIGDFTNIPAPGGVSKIETVLGLRLIFMNKDLVPEKLFLIGDKNPSAKFVTLDGHGDRIDTRGFKATVSRQELPNRTVVLFVHVYKWPIGDPRVGG